MRVKIVRSGTNHELANAARDEFAAGVQYLCKTEGYIAACPHNRGGSPEVCTVTSSGVPHRVPKQVKVCAEGQDKTLSATSDIPLQFRFWENREALGMNIAGQPAPTDLQIS